MGRAREMAGNRRAFTLIELLLVVVMIGLMMAIAVPTFVESIRSHRIKVSADYIRMLNQYARSTAILTKRDIRIYYDVFNGEVQLSVEQQALSGNVTEQFFEASGLMEGGMPTLTEAEPEYDEEGNPVARSANLDEERKRKKMERNVQISDFTGMESKINDNGFWIHYYPSGMCDAHQVILTDDRGDGDILEAIIDVEAITGRVLVEVIE